ncbi:pheromone A receptor-domain-containing protein [Chaetomidium leptoderma]|uniref:Pheromone A receptor-domain-containing protein n=1 Tax=Chaetomidium leptoderma TaxID=669021 RepID=A0AAN7A0S0_9PEZI|nr:pheromone A receptor-domain-containing protein [Chaetomidium leptoderma]
MTSTNSSMPTSKWAGTGFTTTPEERIGPPPPYSSPGLEANLFFRVFLGLISLFVTWVPARLLWRNGEFAGTVLCVMLLILNFITVINALIWRDDNVQTWWAGYGWCDIQAYIFFALHTAFNISLFEIMRSLAGKVALTRALKLTRSERRRQRIVSALVIFTFPVIQVILTYFTTFSRYNVSTLVGCSAIYYPNWLYLVFYILPTPVFAVGAAFMAALTFYRYWKIEKVTRDVTRSHDGIAAARQERVRKKLYFIALVCIIIVLPLIMTIMFINIVEGAPWGLPYDFDALHFGPDPFNQYFISFTTSNELSFYIMNIAFIGELAGIFVFIPFGTTPEALNMYRELLLAVGMGHVFPKLKEEYVPRAKRGSGFSWGSLVHPLRGKSLLGTSTTSTRKDSLLPTVEQVSLASRTGRARSSSLTQHQPKDFTMGPGINALPYPEKAVATAHHNPRPDLSTTDLDVATAQIEAGPPPPSRNPFPVLPTSFAKPLPPTFPPLSIPTLLHNQPQQSTTTLPTNTTPSSLRLNGPHPRKDTTTTTPASATATAIKPHHPLTDPSSSTTTSPPSPWSNNTSARTVGVDTRVWAAAPDDNNNNNGEEEEECGGGDNIGRGGRRIVVERGVRVETTRIARRSMDMGDGDTGGRADRSSTSAAS